MCDLDKVSKIELLNILKEQLERKKKKLEALKNRRRHNTDSVNISLNSTNLTHKSQEPAKLRTNKLESQNDSIKEKSIFDKNSSTHVEDDVSITSVHLDNNSYKTNAITSASSISCNETNQKGLEKFKSYKHRTLDFDLPEDEFSELKQIQEFITPVVEHFPVFLNKTRSKIIDFDWMELDEASTNQMKQNVGCLLCTCEDGMHIYKRTDGNLVRTVDWMLENKLKIGRILKVSYSMDASHVVVVLLEESENQCELSLVKFSDNILISRIPLYRFTTPCNPPILCTVLPEYICITSPSNRVTDSGNELSPHKLMTCLHVFHVCVDSLSLLSSKQLDRIEANIRHLVPVIKSSSVCGLSDEGAYLWNYKEGVLLKKISLDVECRNFNLCCDVMHQDKGLLVLAGRTTNEDQGRLIFINPLSDISLSVTLKELIPTSAIDKLRLLRCGGPLQKVVFVSSCGSGRLEVFTMVGKKVTTSRASLPEGWSHGINGGGEMVVRFDSGLKNMFLGWADEFCSCNIEIN